ncbi:hypothetical protein VTH06DRAFT_4904 [Thermothelomyces fergusii]
MQAKLRPLSRRSCHRTLGSSWDRANRAGLWALTSFVFHVAISYGDMQDNGVTRSISNGRTTLGLTWDVLGEVLCGWS